MRWNKKDIATVAASWLFIFSLMGILMNVFNVLVIKEMIIPEAIMLYEGFGSTFFIGMLSFAIAVLFNGVYLGNSGKFLSVFGLIALLSVIGYFSCYDYVATQGIYQKRLFVLKHIEWDDIEKIKLTSTKSSKSTLLSLNYFVETKLGEEIELVGKTEDLVKVDEVVRKKGIPYDTRKIGILDENTAKRFNGYAEKILRRHGLVK